MKHQMHLINEEVKDRAKEFIDDPGSDGHELIIRPFNESRSIAQRNLMWVWNTVIAEEFGESKEDVHFRHKKRFLVPIYERDDPEYAQMIESVRELYRQKMKDQAKFLFDRIVSMTSTNDAKVKQMTEFLNDIEMDARKNGLLLPHPDFYYRLAMGRAA